MCALGQAAPLLDGHEHGSLLAAHGHELRAFAQARLKELTESGFGILHRPALKAVGAFQGDHRRGNLVRIPVSLTGRSRPESEDYRERTGVVHGDFSSFWVFWPRSDGPEGIACWFIDTDYNEESFFVRHAYFLGANDPYQSLKTALRAEIDEEAWASLYSDISRPFPRPSTGRIAVKVINHFGDEVLKVYPVPAPASGKGK